VPFTLRNLKKDLEDVGSNFDGAPDLEFRLATKALELEQSGLSYQRVPPGYRFPYGHTHQKQEEVYVVLSGSGRMKLDDEIVELKEWDAVRVPPGTWRGYEAGPEGLEIIVIGAPNLGEDPGSRVAWIETTNVRQLLSLAGMQQLRRVFFASWRKRSARTRTTSKPPRPGTGRFSRSGATIGS
jgi:mannose-6-phosphate isomerase-like protein (cupin superfamily)